MVAEHMSSHAAMESGASRAVRLQRPALRAATRNWAGGWLCLPTVTRPWLADLQTTAVPEPRGCYTRTGGVWSQLGGKMAGTGVAGGYSDQGAAVALSGDAHTAILSGYRDNTDKGAVWMFSSWPEPAGLRVVAPASAMQGAGFQFGVTAVDSSGVPVGNYSGPVHFTSSDAAAVLTADSPLSYGAGKFTATLNTPGAETITAADAAMAFSAGTSNSIRVTAAGVATHFDLAAPETALTGTPFSFTVTAADASDNPVASYAKTVHFTSSDSAAVLPPDAPLVNGTGTFTATLQTTWPPIPQRHRHDGVHTVGEIGGHRGKCSAAGCHHDRGRQRDGRLQSQRADYHPQRHRYQHLHCE